jgi:hypothetical protein
MNIWSTSQVLVSDCFSFLRLHAKMATVDPQMIEAANTEVEEVDFEDVAGLNSFLESSEERMYALYVCYPLALVPHNGLIIKTVEYRIATAPGFSPTSWHATEFKLPDQRDRQHMRLLVNFLDKADADAFINLRHVQVTTPDGTVHNLAVVAPNIQFKEVDGLPILIFKRVPDTCTLGQIRYIFTHSIKGKEPYCSDLRDMQWMSHRNSASLRKILMAKAVPPAKDTTLSKLPSCLYLKQLGLFIVGCTRHICIYCGRKGHQAAVHDSFLQGGIRRNEEEEHPPSAAELALKNDSFMTLDNSPSSREAWTCNHCTRPDGSLYSGHGFSSAMNHLNTYLHQAALQHMDDNFTDRSPRKINLVKLFLSCVFFQLLLEIYELFVWAVFCFLTMILFVLHPLQYVRRYSKGRQ